MCKEGLKRYFIKEDIHMAKKLMQYLASLVIKETQIKTTVR